MALKMVLFLSLSLKVNERWSEVVSHKRICLDTEGEEKAVCNQGIATKFNL